MTTNTAILVIKSIQDRMWGRMSSAECEAFKMSIEAMEKQVSIDRILERLEEEKSDWNYDYNVPINRAIEIIKEEVQE